MNAITQLPPLERPKRADARRNYDRLLSEARASFAEHGTDASLEDIARHAGVGIGTLYRHFPTRLDLLEAVYREEVDGLQQAAERLTPEHAPFEALEKWLEVFVDYAATKKHIFHELVEATPHGVGALRTVHDPDLLEFLATAADR